MNKTKYIYKCANKKGGCGLKLTEDDLIALGILPICKCGDDMRQYKTNEVNHLKEN